MRTPRGWKERLDARAAATDAARRVRGLRYDFPDVISVVELAQRIGYTLEVDPATPKGFRGKAPDRDGSIWLGVERDSRTFNNTIGHEIGHNHVSPQPHWLLEETCEDFSACLQMPPEAFLRSALFLGGDILKLAKVWVHSPQHQIAKRLTHVMPNVVSGEWTEFRPDWLAGDHEYVARNDVRQSEEEALSGAYTLHYPYCEVEARNMLTRAWCIQSGQVRRGFTVSIVTD